MAIRKSLNGNNTRAEILAAASRLFIEQGVDNTSLKDIARACNLSTGTLFYYYASKSDLIFDVTDAYFDDLTHRLLEWAVQSYDQNDAEKILQVVFERITGDLMRGKLHHYLVQAAVSNEPAIRERFQQKYTEWRVMIESALVHFIQDDEQCSLTAHIILATLDGLVLQAILGIEDIPIQSISTYLAKSLNQFKEVNEG